jgi:hypothetical protein
MSALRDFVDEGPVGKRRLPVLSQAELRGIDREPTAASTEPEAEAEDWEAEEAEFEPERALDLGLFES